jgi:hypothetical protein
MSRRGVYERDQFCSYSDPPTLLQLRSGNQRAEERLVDVRARVRRTSDVWSIQQ